MKKFNDQDDNGTPNKEIPLNQLFHSNGSSDQDMFSSNSSNSSPSNFLASGSSSPTSTGEPSSEDDTLAAILRMFEQKSKEERLANNNNNNDGSNSRKRKRDAFDTDGDYRQSKAQNDTPEQFPEVVNVSSSIFPTAPNNNNNNNSNMGNPNQLGMDPNASSSSANTTTTTQFSNPSGFNIFGGQDPFAFSQLFEKNKIIIPEKPNPINVVVGQPDDPTLNGMNQFNLNNLPLSFQSNDPLQYNFQIQQQQQQQQVLLEQQKRWTNVEKSLKEQNQMLRFLLTEQQRQGKEIKKIKTIAMQMYYRHAQSPTMNNSNNTSSNNVGGPLNSGSANHFGPKMPQLPAPHPGNQGAMTSAGAVSANLSQSFSNLSQTLHQMPTNPPQQHASNISQQNKQLLMLLQQQQQQQQQDGSPHQAFGISTQQQQFMHQQARKMEPQQQLMGQQNIISGSSSSSAPNGLGTADQTKPKFHNFSPRLQGPDVFQQQQQQQQQQNEQIDNNKRRRLDKP